MDNYNELNEEKEPDDLLRENIIRRNKKKINQGSELTGKSMLKKSDLSLVFIGAGLITLIIFFVFLRPSGDITEKTNEQGNPPIAETVKALEQKLTTLEEMLQAINASQATSTTEEGAPKTQMSDIKPYVARIERVETALSVKFDVLTARVDKMDDKLSDIIKDVEKNNRTVSSMKNIAAAVQPSKREESIAVKQNTVEHSDLSDIKSATKETKSVAKEITPIVKETKPVAKETKPVAKEITPVAKFNSKSSEQSKKNATTQNVATKSQNTVSTKLETTTKAVSKTAKPTTTKTASVIQSKQQKTGAQVNSVYHTVGKGDTLYNISKKYSTTVDQLRTMNRMTMQDSIVIGQRIVVKK